MIVRQRQPDPAEMDGHDVTTVLTVVDRGLLCELCGWDTRVDTHVYGPDRVRIITLTGCTQCRTGLYGSTR